MTTATKPSTRRRRAPAEPGGYVAYVRVSTDEQAASGLGLAAQRSAILSECERRGWTEPRIFEDAASGKTLDRPGLAEALTECEAGRAAGLVVAKLDRLSRSLLDFAGLMEQSRQQGWRLVALDLGIDTGTPQGELMASVLASFSQFERRLISARTKAALAEKKAKGEKVGRPRSIPDETIAYICQLRSEGLSFRAVADRLNAEGVPSGQGGRWHGPAIHRALALRKGE